MNDRQKEVLLSRRSVIVCTFVSKERRQTIAVMDIGNVPGLDATMNFKFGDWELSGCKTQLGA